MKGLWFYIGAFFIGLSIDVDTTSLQRTNQS